MPQRSQPDIVHRLRSYKVGAHDGPPLHPAVCDGAADEIDRLRDEGRDDLSIVLSALRYLEEVTGETFDDEGGVIAQIERDRILRPEDARHGAGHARRPRCCGNREQDMSDDLPTTPWEAGGVTRDRFVTGGTEREGIFSLGDVNIFPASGPGPVAIAAGADIAAQIIKAVNNHLALVAELRRLHEICGHQTTADILAAVGSLPGGCD